MVTKLSSAIYATKVNSMVADDTIALCQSWFDLRTERHRLQTRWSDLEAWLADHHNWNELEDTEQRRLPEGRELFEIDAQLAELFEQSENVLRLLPSLPAPSPSAIAAKLKVASKLIWPMDNPQAHLLITAAMRDVAALDLAKDR